jgi:MFS family permease
VSERSKLFYGWWVLLSAATVLMTAFSMASYALPVFYPELVRAFHWPRASVALGGSLKTLLIGLVAPLNGWFIDRKGVKAILLAGIVTVGISYAMLSGIHSTWQYLVVCFFLGVGGSWIHHLPTQLLAANWFVKKRGMAIGLLTGFGGFGDTLVPLLCVVLIERSGWRETLLILPLLLIVPFLAVAFLVRNSPQEIGLHPDGSVESLPTTSTASSHAAHSAPTGFVAETASARSVSESANFRSAAFWMLAALLLLTGWAMFSVWQHIPLFLRDGGYNASLFSLFLFSSTLSRFVSGPLSDRITADYTTLLNLLLIALALLALLFTRSTAMIYFSMIFFGFGYGGSITCRPLIVFEHFGGKGVGRLYGVATALFTTGAFFGPAVAGRIYDRTKSYHLAFLLALAFIILSMILLLLLRRTAERPNSAK